MRFIHTADLHLGMLPDKDEPWGPARADAVRTSLLRLTEICAREDVDLLLIAGDLFHAPPTERELKDADYLFSTLPRTKVVLIAGNHDFVRPGSAYARFAFCPQVTFLSSPELSSVFFPQWDLEVHGFSYDAQVLTDDRLDTFRAPEDGRRHILLAHGGDADHLPLHPARIAANGWDYAALGHLHRPALAQDGRVAIPGSPEALDRSETGAHGFYLGTMKKNEFSLEWRTFSDFRYTEVTVNMTPEMTASGLESLIRRRADDLAREVLNVRLVGRRDPAFVPDREALLRIGGVAEVTDDTLPDYPLEEYLARPAGDLLGRFVRSFTEDGKADDPSARKSLYYGLDALLSTAGGGKEAIR